MFRRLSRPLEAAFLLILTLASPAGLAARTAPAGEPVIAITHATILTVTNGVIADGTVLIRGGQIAAVGANVAVPSGAEVIDGTGKFVSPGIIDCHSHIAADSINEGGTTVSSMTGIEDVFNPTDIDIYRDLAGGVTTANVLHGSANPIGGKNFVIKLRWGKPRAEDFVFEGAMPGIKFALGENPKRHGGGAGAAGHRPARYPGTRHGRRVRDPRRVHAREGVPERLAGLRRRKKAGEDVLPPRRDLQLEPLVEVLEGKRLVHAHCYRADEILMLLRVADEFGFKIATLQHVLEGYKVAKEIAAHGAGASTFADWWGYKIEAVDAIPYNAALMTRKGVRRLDQLRRRRARAAPEHRGREVDQVRRPHRRRGARAGHDQPGEAAAHRQSRRLARSRQGRRRRHLESSSAQQLRHRRSRLHRRHALLRPIERGPARHGPEDEEGRAAEGGERGGGEGEG